MNVASMASATTLVVILGVPGLAQAQRQGEPTLTGTFDLEFVATWGPTKWTFDLEQDGEVVIGVSDQGMGTLMLEGTIRGHEISFVIELEDGPHAMTLQCEGTAGVDGIAGSIEFIDMPGAEAPDGWTLTRVDT